jgi:hypothetical protein
LPFGAACAALAIALVMNVDEDRRSIAPQQNIAPIEALEPEQIDRSVEDLEMLRQFSTPAQINRV